MIHQNKYIMYKISSSSLLFAIDAKNLEEVCDYLNKCNEDFGTLKIELAELKVKFRKNSRAKFTAKRSWIIVEKIVGKKKKKISLYKTPFPIEGGLST